MTARVNLFFTCVCVRAQVAVDMQAVSLCDIKAEIRVDGAAAWETGY